MNELNKAELRRLAEAMPELDWDSQFEDHEQTGFFCVYAKPFELDGEMHDGPTFVERCHPEQAKFIAEAKENVLSLLDECELLRNCAKGDFDLDVWLEWAKEAQALRSQNAGLIAQHGRDSVELSKQCHARDKAEAERDAALAKLACYRASRIAYASEFAPDAEGDPDVNRIHENIRKLKAELEACRKDAERYRWLREKVGVDHIFGDYNVWVPAAREDITAIEKETTDQAIDAAMSQGKP